MAKEPTLKFVDVERDMPAKRDPAQRRSDFDEIYAEYAQRKAEEQASRCSQCGVPFCQSHCPLHNNIPDWLRMTATGRLREAYEISQATNTFPEICGRICPQDRLCEGNCVIEQSGHGTVTIGSVEKYITDTAWCITMAAAESCTGCNACVLQYILPQSCTGAVVTEIVIYYHLSSLYHAFFSYKKQKTL